MIIHRLRSFAEYHRHAARLAEVHATRRQHELNLQLPHRTSFTVKGFSYPAKRMVDFIVDFQHGHGPLVNWREWLICPVTKLNNRVRACIHLLDSELGMTPDESAYITEQVTPLYTFLSRRHARLSASEFLGGDVPPGTVTPHGIRNEDLTRLSYPTASFDVAMSFDCLEHMPDPMEGFQEMARVIRPGGKLMWSVPFRHDLEANLVRASIATDGTVVHHHPPEYHGDPLNKAGCLCFTHFGWNMLDEVRRAGFRDAYALAYWSDMFGYLGTEQFVFVALR
jgi:SAM-dependent methyltransferase